MMPMRFYIISITFSWVFLSIQSESIQGDQSKPSLISILPTTTINSGTLTQSESSSTTPGTQSPSTNVAITEIEKTNKTELATTLAIQLGELSDTESNLVTPAASGSDTEADEINQFNYIIDLKSTTKPSEQSSLISTSTQSESSSTTPGTQSPSTNVAITEIEKTNKTELATTLAIQLGELYSFESNLATSQVASGSDSVANEVNQLTSMIDLRSTTEPSEQSSLISTSTQSDRSSSPTEKSIESNHIAITTQPFSANVTLNKIEKTNETELTQTPAIQLGELASTESLIGNSFSTTSQLVTTENDRTSTTTILYTILTTSSTISRYEESVSNSNIDSTHSTLSVEPTSIFDKTKSTMLPNTSPLTTEENDPSSELLVETTTPSSSIISEDTTTQQVENVTTKTYSTIIFHSDPFPSTSSEYYTTTRALESDLITSSQITDLLTSTRLIQDDVPDVSTDHCITNTVPFKEEETVNDVRPFASFSITDQASSDNVINSLTTPLISQEETKYTTSKTQTSQTTTFTTTSPTDSQISLFSTSTNAISSRQTSKTPRPTRNYIKTFIITVPSNSEEPEYEFIPVRIYN